MGAVSMAIRPLGAPSPPGESARPLAGPWGPPGEARSPPRSEEAGASASRRLPSALRLRRPAVRERFAPTFQGWQEVRAAHAADSHRPRFADVAPEVGTLDRTCPRIGRICLAFSKRPQNRPRIGQHRYQHWPEFGRYRPRVCHHCPTIEQTTHGRSRPGIGRNRAKFTQTWWVSPQNLPTPLTWHSAGCRVACKSDGGHTRL